MEKIINEIEKARQITAGSGSTDRIRRYQLGAAELVKLMDAHKDETKPDETLFNLCLDLFQLGFYRGMRYQKGEQGK